MRPALVATAEKEDTFKPISAWCERDLRNHISVWLDHWLPDNEAAIEALQRIISDIERRK